MNGNDIIDFDQPTISFGSALKKNVRNIIIYLYFIRIN